MDVSFTDSDEMIVESSMKSGAAPSTSSSRRQQFLPLDPASVRQDGNKFVHIPTGYTWEKDEEAPAHSWRSKKAQEEHNRAMDQIVDKDLMIGKKYGDIGLDASESSKP